MKCEAYEIFCFFLSLDCTYLAVDQNKLHSCAWKHIDSPSTVWPG